MSVNVQCTRCGEWFVVPSDSTVATAPPHTCITPVPPERDYDDLLEFHSKTVTQYQQQCVEKDAEIARLEERIGDLEVIPNLWVLEKVQKAFSAASGNGERPVYWWSDLREELIPILEAHDE